MHPYYFVPNKNKENFRPIAKFTVKNKVEKSHFAIFLLHNIFLFVSRDMCTLS